MYDGDLNHAIREFVRMQGDNKYFFDLYLIVNNK